MYKKALLFNLILAGSLLGQSPITENISADQWTDSNKATLLRGEVKREGKLLFTIERLGNAAYIKLPKTPSALQRGIWNFEVNHAGHSSFASWDSKKRGWKFLLTEKGNYTVYVSKRKNRNESLAHSWFVLSY
jgi:hypothetical protein